MPPPSRDAVHLLLAELRREELAPRAASLLQRFGATFEVASANAGVDRVLLLRFDARLAAFSAETFIDRVLVQGLGARAVVVGDDFRYGAKRSGDLALLKQRGATARFSAEGLGSVWSCAPLFAPSAVHNALGLPPAWEPILPTCLNCYTISTAGRRARIAAAQSFRTGSALSATRS